MVIFMTYEEAVAYILAIPKFTKKNEPSHTRELMRYLGNPQDQFAYLHVAGSNGKGSVCAYLTRVLTEGGISVGTFTSPHLADIRERICIQGNLCSRQQFLESFEAVMEAVKRMQADGFAHPTFFECLYACAMVLFAREQVACAVVETGRGGRLDATNVRKAPTLTVITSISLEHTEILGDSIEQIAGEKAGIIKPAVPVVFDGNDSRAAAVIRRRAGELGAPALEITKKSIKILLKARKKIDFSLDCGYDVTNVSITSQAPYQVMNAALALAAVQTLCQGRLLPGRLTREAVTRGFERTCWPGRMEEIRTGIYLDGAHNAAGIRAFLEAAGELIEEKAILLFSMVGEKDYGQALELLCRSGLWAEIVFTEIPENARALPAECLMDTFLGQPEAGSVGVTAIADAREALKTALVRRRPGQLLFCAGSLYLIGALRMYLEAEPDEIGTEFD